MVFGVGGVKRGDENCDIKQQLENFPSFACSSSSSRGIMRVVVLLVGVRVCEWFLRYFAFVSFLEVW